MASVVQSTLLLQVAAQLVHQAQSPRFQMVSHKLPPPPRSARSPMVKFKLLPRPQHHQHVFLRSPMVRFRLPPAAQCLRSLMVKFRLLLVAQSPRSPTVKSKPPPSLPQPHRLVVQFPRSLTVRSRLPPAAQFLRSLTARSRLLHQPDLLLLPSLVLLAVRLLAHSPSSPVLSVPSLCCKYFSILRLTTSLSLTLSKTSGLAGKQWLMQMVHVI